MLYPYLRSGFYLGLGSLRTYKSPAMTSRNQMNWVEINLPYSSTGVAHSDIAPPYPNLEEEELAKFGVTRSSLWDQFSKDINMMRHMEVITKAAECGVPYDQREIAASKYFKEAWLSDNPEYQEAHDASLLREQIRIWQDAHPDMIAYDESYTKNLKADKLMTFLGRGLAKAGVQIEMADGKRYMIGDINKAAGICGYNQAFDDTSIVIRYRVLLQPNQTNS